MTWGDFSRAFVLSFLPLPRKTPASAFSPEANRRRLGFRSPGTRRPLEPPRHRIPATALRPQPPAVPLRSPPPDPAAPPRCLQLRVGAGWLGFGFPVAEAEPPPPPRRGSRRRARARGALLILLRSW
ncbi:hypothetical protein PVAP13_7NG106178 [Panicum virgatum]|uniref:Uncharacterized protein n=1 Tax=Panicum virgatum TaxID=38727 RepID=A0A8T0PRA9_PANVG|nr:hypothetical protein PVAP13_7NG106178 [Panicum virgatum]